MTQRAGRVHFSWRACFALTSVDAASAAIYGGVLFAHILGPHSDQALWRSAMSIGLVLALFAIDRAESLWFPLETTPPYVAISLLLVRIAIMGLVVGLEASTPAWFLFLIPAFRACLYFGSRTSYLVAAVTWLGFSLKHWSDPSDLARGGLQDIILFAMALVFVCTIARALLEERVSRQHTEELLAELAHSHTQLQAHAQIVAELATTEERNRLARDIHDSLGHFLTVTNVQLAKALAFQYRDPLVAEQAMRHAKDTAHDALSAVRQSVGALRTTRDGFVFAAAMSALVERTGTDGCEITMRIEGNEAFFEPEIRTALYHVAQEGLTNIQKHAHATEVTVHVGFGESDARLTIRDNGRGFVRASSDDADHGVDGGYGLHSMRERLARVGGDFTIATQPGQGTTLTASAPPTRSATAALPSVARQNGSGAKS